MLGVVGNPTLRPGGESYNTTVAPQTVLDPTSEDGAARLWVDQQGETMSKEHAILVGIDGSRAAWSALDWAGEHAERTGRTLLIVHVGDTYTMPGGVSEQPFGRDLLADAIATVAEKRPQVAVTTRLMPGDPADVLVELSGAADLVAVGRGRSGIAGLVLGSVADRVLRHARCPVAIIPRGARITANTIVVGASDTDGGRAALRFAFEEAMHRSADLVVVRSWLTFDWRISNGPVPRMSDVDAWQDQEEALLDASLEPLRRAFPEVKVRTLITHEPVELALEREAHDAAMLVLGCRRTDEAHLARMGSITSWAAHHFDCPVVVVGHPRVDVVEDRVTDTTPVTAGAVTAD